MGRMIPLKLAAVCLLFTILPSATAFSVAEDAAQAMGLLPRASTCSLPGFASCNQDGLPDDFCCPVTSTCVPFNNKKSAICCPAGQTCSIITAISCDISQQNATLHPESQLFSTELTGSLASCNGNRCCPNGYSCQNNECSLDTSSTTAKTPSNTATSSTSASTQKSTSSSSSASAATSPTSTSTTATPTPSGSATTSSSVPQAHCPQFTPAGTLVGFFAGLAVGILVTVIFLCCFGHRRRDNASSPISPEFSNVRASISDPIYKNMGSADAVRADFLRKQPRKSLRSIFSRSSTMRSRSAPVDGIGRSILKGPQTPVNQRSPSLRMNREPSMESIKIYSPPGGGLGRPGTQLGDMLNQVGWDPTKPYLGSPGRVDPRSRGLGDG